MVSRNDLNSMHDLLADVCAAIGLPRDSVTLSEDSVDVDDAGLSVALAPWEGRVQWHVRERYRVADLSKRGGFREVIDTVLVADRQEGPRVARAAGMAIAQRKVDAAIDLAVG